MKILVVEDQAIESKLAIHVLLDAGHDVTGVDVAEAALAVIKADPPGIILMDLMLPGTDGLDLIRKLKGDPETRNIQIVAVTAHPEKYSRRLAIEAGCDAYLEKPLSTRTLPATLIEVAKKAERVDR